MTIKCPYGDLRLTIPDVWTVGHYEKWARGNREAAEAFGPGVSVGTMRLFGCIALCEKIEGGLADSPVSEWPLPVFNWIVDTIYENSFKAALHPEKKVLSPSPITPMD